VERTGGEDISSTSESSSTSNKTDRAVTRKAGGSV
jgi:hypothetical protein